MAIREGKNILNLVGTLKEKEVKRGTTKKGDEFISLKLTVVSNIDSKLMENKVEFFAMKTSKLATGYETIANDYKEGERVEIRGSYDVNEYVNKDGEFKSFARIKGLYANRVESEEIKDKAGFEVESVVSGTKQELGKDGLPTGRLSVNLYTVGYNSTILEHTDLKVEKEHADAFRKAFPIGSTGTFKARINRYAVVKDVVDTTARAFGEDDATIGSVVMDYVNDVVIFTGTPASITTKYTTEAIQEMRKIREMAINEKKLITIKPKEVEAPAFGEDDYSDNSPF